MDSVFSIQLLFQFSIAFCYQVQQIQVEQSFFIRQSIRIQLQSQKYLFVVIEQMFMILYAILVTLIISANGSAFTGCNPFGARLALGRNYFNEKDLQMLSIRFNTKQPCLKSYVTLEIDSTIKKVYCDSTNVSFSNYTSYSHACSFDFLAKGSSFQYMIYGWSGNSSDPAIPYSKQNIKSHLIQNGKVVKMLVLADWGYLQQKANVYNKLDDALNYILSLDDQPDLIYLGGDYAYDLSTNYGRSYQSFLVMLSQISSVWPCIFMTGNHEYYTNNDFMLFNKSFELYNLTNQNATILDLGSFTFVMTDPYAILFENATKTNILSKFKSYLDKASKSKPLVVSTHYPLACSGSSTHCKNQRFILSDFFDMMIDYDTVFYIGAHYHTYERIYPYVKGGNFQLSKSPYNFNKKSKYLISVVEGIAGNDKSIVQSYGKLSNFTAALSYNITGYGIMEIDNKILKYDHYKATDWKIPVDSLVIKFDQLFQSSHLRLEVE